MSTHKHFIRIDGCLINVNAISCIYPDDDDHVKIFFIGDDEAAGYIRVRATFSDIEQKLAALQE